MAKSKEVSFFVGGGPSASTDGQDMHVTHDLAGTHDADGRAEIHVKHTHEGIVVDLVVGDGSVLENASLTNFELVEALFDEDVLSDLIDQLDA